jgi:hypothetical protein
VFPIEGIAAPGDGRTPEKSSPQAMTSGDNTAETLRFLTAHWRILPSDSMFNVRFWIGFRLLFAIDYPAGIPYSDANETRKEFPVCPPISNNQEFFPGN